MTELPYAEDCPYWKTGRSDPSTIMGQITQMIEDNGGKILQELQGTVAGKAGFLLEFELDGDTYRVTWPVLESRYENPDRSFPLAAKRQAVTFMKHDIKAKVMSAKVLGARAAFSPYLITERGATVMEAVQAETQGVVRMLKGG